MFMYNSMLYKSVMKGIFFWANKNVENDRDKERLTRDLELLKKNGQRSSSYHEA